MRGGGLNDLVGVGIYALMHDVGKPILRFMLRFKEGIEVGAEAEEVVKLLSSLGINEGLITDAARSGKYPHEVLSSRIYGWVKGEAPPSNFRELVAQADRLSAAERGFGETYEEVSRHFKEIEDHVNRVLGLSVRYAHHTAPLLTPLWLLRIAGYLEGVGPKKLCGGSWSLRKGLGRLRESPLSKAVTERDAARLKELIAGIIKGLAGEDAWLPVRALTPEFLASDSFRLRKLEEAMRDCRYSEVVKWLLTLISRAKTIYSYLAGGTTSPGLADTLLHVLRATTLLTPSAIYGSVAPDISLYSHSKLVAAYASSLAKAGKVALMVIDANGIQRFIYSARRAAASSRLMRGRSLIVELALESLSRYALELLGVPLESNAVISEGGTLTLVIPWVGRERIEGHVVRRLEDAARSVSDFLGGELGFTITVSEPFDASLKSFLTTGSGGEGRKTYFSIMDSLRLRVSERKLIRSATVVADSAGKGWRPPESYDALTKEPIPAGARPLRVSESSKDYVDSIAGGDKLSVGDAISEATHLSLVAGTSLRNAIAIISIYAYGMEGDAVSVNSGLINRLVAELQSRLSRHAAEHVPRIGEQLYFTLPLPKGGSRFSIGLVPLPPLGSLHLIVSLSVEQPVDIFSEETAAGLWSIMTYVLGDVLAPSIKEVMGRGEDTVRVRVKVVNNPLGFLPPYEGGDVVPEGLRSFLSVLSELGVDLGFGYVWLNTYHPVRVPEGGGLTLVSLDEYGVIALAKLDLDMFGDAIMLLHSISPSRASSASDLVNLVTAGVTYLTALKEAIRLGSEGRNFDAIPLYGGGDDVVLYGSVGGVSYLLATLTQKILQILHPVSASASMIVDHSHTPVLDMYSEALSRLGKAKEVRLSISLTADEPRQLRLPAGCRVKEEVINVIPASPEGVWGSVGVTWCFDVLGKFFNPAKVRGNLSKLREYVRVLHNVSYLGHLSQRYLLSKKSEDRVRVIVSYAYLWSRMEALGRDRLKELNELLRSVCGGAGLPDPTDTDNVVSVLASAKPIIDLILLALRRESTAVPSSKH